MALDREQERRLKRGLEDLSPLFQSRGSPVASPAPPSFKALFDVQFLTVCVPDHEGDAFLANAYVASQIVRRTNLFASLVSIAPGLGTFPSRGQDPFSSLELLDSRISRLLLSHQELWSLSQNGFTSEEPPSSSQGTGGPRRFLIFLEFEPSQFRSLARMSLLLDRMVLFVAPHVDSLREGYRLIKMFWNLNREIEFFLLFQGGASSRSREAFLFERFSLITSRFLGVSPGWLGDLAFPRQSARPWPAFEESLGFDLEPILQAEKLRRPLAPEKNRFWHWLWKTVQSRFPDESRP